jgi:hypothetical protein
MRRKLRPTVCISLRITFDAELDEPFLKAFAATPRGKRAALVRSWLRAGYHQLAQAGEGREGTEQDHTAWVEELLLDSEDDE